MSLKPDPWETLAACAHSDPDSFFYDPKESPGEPAKPGDTSPKESPGEPAKPGDTSPTKTAKRTCKGDAERKIPPCPVAAQCLKKALELDIRFGIWGGLSNRERQKLKTMRRR